MSDSPVKLKIFIDYVCPWCYLGSDSVEKLAARKDIDIEWIPFPLHPDTPPEGMSLKAWLGDGVDAAHQRLYQIMDSINLAYNPDRIMTYNSRLAQELGMWADTQPGGSKLHKLIFQAYFVHDRNIAQPEVLLDCVKEAGLDVEAAREVLEQRRFSNQVDQAWMSARQQQVSGVPSFVAGAYITSGYHPVEELEKFIDYVEMQQARGA